MNEVASNVETDEAIVYICYLAAFHHRMAESGSGQEKRYGAEEGAARSNRRNHYYHTACMTHGRGGEGGEEAVTHLPPQWSGT